jgi:hypothetical protein
LLSNLSSFSLPHISWILCDTYQSAKSCLNPAIFHANLPFFHSEHIAAVMAPVKVLLIGATGETGRSIANGLLTAGGFVRFHAASYTGISLSFSTNPRH